MKWSKKLKHVTQAVGFKLIQRPDNAHSFNIPFSASLYRKAPLSLPRQKARRLKIRPLGKRTRKAPACKQRRNSGVASLKNQVFAPPSQIARIKNRSHKEWLFLKEATVKGHIVCLLEYTAKEFCGLGRDDGYNREHLRTNTRTKDEARANTGTITARIVSELLLGDPQAARFADGLCAVGRSGRSEQVTLHTAIKE